MANIFITVDEVGNIAMHQNGALLIDRLNADEAGMLLRFFQASIVFIESESDRLVTGTRYFDLLISEAA